MKVSLLARIIHGALGRWLPRASPLVAVGAMAGYAMLGLKPDLARDVSFQLSFAGTIGIATMTDGIASRLRLLPAVLRAPTGAPG